MLADPRGRGPAILLRAAGVERDAAAAILLLLNSRGPLVSGAEGDATAEQLELFDTLDEAAAARGAPPLAGRIPPIAPASPASRPAPARPPRRHERRAASNEDAVTGRVDAEGRLVAADPPLAALHAQAGGDEGGVLAVPQIAALARLARRLGITISRAALAADGEQDVDLWVRAEPEGDEVALAITGWSARAAARRRAGPRRPSARPISCAPPPTGCGRPTTPCA